MRRTVTTAAVVALAFGGLTVAAPAYAVPPGGGAGCQGFGNNVADLAQDRGRDFGGLASGVAQSGPGNLPKIVVTSEKEAECS